MASPDSKRSKSHGSSGVTPKILAFLFDRVLVGLNSLGSMRMRTAESYSPPQLMAFRS